MSPSFRAIGVLYLAWFTGTAPAGEPQEQRLPTGAMLRMGSTRLWHGAAVTGVALTPDGKRAASADYEGSVSIWDTATGFKAFELPAGIGKVVAISPDGKTLATGGTDIRLWNIATGKEIRKLDYRTGVAGGVRAVTFSPDGATLASAAGALGLGDSDPVIRLWEVGTGKPVREFRGAKNGAYAVAFSPNGKTLATAGGSRGTAPGDTAIRLWEVESGKEIRQLKGNKGWVYSLSFSADGKKLVSASPYEVRIWDPAEGKELLHLENASYAAAFSPTANRLAVGKPLALRDPANGRAITSMNGVTADCIAFSDDGRMLISGSSDGRVRLWDTASGKEISRARGHEQPVCRVAYSPDGRLVASTSSGDHSLRIWGTASGAQLRRIPIGCTTESHWCRIDGHDLFFTPDGKTVVTWSCDGVVHFWDLTTGKGRELSIGERWVTAVTLSPDGKFVAAAHPLDGSGCGVMLYDAATGKTIKTMRPYGEKEDRDCGVACLAFSPDGKTIALGASNNRRGFRREKPKGDTILLYETASGKLLRGFRTDETAPSALVFSPDGRTLYSGATATTLLQVWEVATGKERSTIARTRGDWRRSEFPPPFALSRDEKYLAFPGEGNEIVIWELLTEKEVRRFPGHAKKATCLAFAPDGKSLVSGSEDTNILLWQLGGAPARNLPDEKGGAAGRFKRHWEDLGAGDPAAADQAFWAMVGAGDQAVAWMKTRLQPARAFDPAQLPGLVGDLADVGKRPAAVAGLKEFGARAEPALYHALRNQANPAVRQQIELVLEAINETPIAPAELQHRRAVSILERIASPASEELLRHLSKGDPHAEPTQAARAALKRFEERRRLGAVKVLTDEEVLASRRCLVGNRMPRSLAGHSGLVSALAFTRDGRQVLSSGLDGVIYLRDVRTGKEVRRLHGHKGGVFDLVLAPDGKTFVSAGADRLARLWDLASGQQLHSFVGHKDAVTSAAFSPDGKVLATGSTDGTICLWETDRRQLVRQFAAGVPRVTSVAFAPGGESLAVAGLVREQNAFAGGISYSQPASICLWDPRTGKEQSRLPISGSRVAFLADGRTLVATGHFIRIERNHKGRGFIQMGDTSCFSETQLSWWDLAGKTEIRQLRGSGGAFGLSPDNQTFALVAGHELHHETFRWGTNMLGSGAEPGLAIRLWEKNTGKVVLKGPAREATAVAFSPDGRTLVWGEEKGLVKLWEVAPEEPLSGSSNNLRTEVLDKLWNDLAGEDAGAAYQAGWILAGTRNQGAAYIRKCLPAAGPVDGKHLARLIADLDSAQFAVRKAAAEELEKIGQAAEPALLAARDRKLSPEAQRQIQILLGGLRVRFKPSELRALRAVVVLERMGSLEAREVLTRLAGGSPTSPLTRETKSALKRMAALESWRSPSK